MIKLDKNRFTKQSQSNCKLLEQQLLLLICLRRINSIKMKPTLVADEMFPEGAGPFMELDEVRRLGCESIIHSFNNNCCRCLGWRLNGFVDGFGSKRKGCSC